MNRANGKRADQQWTRGWVHWSSRVLLLTGILFLVYAGYFYIDGYAFQKMERIALNNPHAPAAPAIEHVIRDGGVIGNLRIDRIGMSVVIAQGDSASVLRRAVGHLPKTPLPGESGNVVLAGHRDTFFRALKDIREGDVITLETERGSYEYIVQSAEIVPPTAPDVLSSSGARELTLITCYPFYFVGPAPNRFVVRAFQSNGTAPVRPYPAR